MMGTTVAGTRPWTNRQNAPLCRESGEAFVPTDSGVDIDNDYARARTAGDPNFRAR